MLYTRKGDGGNTGLFGTKDRVPKDDPLIEALGSIDELNSLTGLCRAHTRERSEQTTEELAQVQEVLFVAQAQLAGSMMRVTNSHVGALEEVIDRIEATIQKPTSFVVPGAATHSALFDFVRTVARRAERAVVRARMEDGTELLAYLNRLSSYFYALARQAAQTDGKAEKPPTYIRS